MNLYISDLQAAFFTPSIDLSNKIALTSGIIEATKKFFDGNPLMIDAPNDVPPEIPRIILKTPNQAYELHIGLNRFDFYYHDRAMVGGIPEKKIEDLKTDLLEKLKLVTAAIKKVTGAKITRLGIVPTFVTKIESGATEYIRKTYFNTAIFTDKLSETVFNTNRKTALDTFHINLGVRGNAFRQVNNPMDNKIVVFNLDINTIKEESLDLNEQDINKFYQSTFEFMEKNLQNYVK
jgi:hypothetical protein